MPRKIPHFTDIERLALGKRAYEHGIMSTIHYFVARPGEEQNLSLCTFTWKDMYSRELKKNPIVKEFPSAKRGRPLLLRNELDARMQYY